MPPVFKQKGAWFALVALGVLVWGGISLYRGRSSGLAEALPEGVYVEGDTVSPALPLMPMPGGTGGTLADYKGKVLLLNFWAGWCAPCLKEMPSLYKLHEKFSPRGFAVLTFNMDEVPADGQAILEKVAGKPPFPLYRGYEQAVFNHFPVEGLPFTAVIDRAGKVIYAEPGERDWMDPVAQQIIEGRL